MIDVVEGSAIEALPHMHSLLNARPDGFGSLEEAVEWQYVLLLLSPPSTLSFAQLERLNTDMVFWIVSRQKQSATHTLQESPYLPSSYKTKTQMRCGSIYGGHH